MKRLANGLEKAVQPNQLTNFLHSYASTSHRDIRNRALLLRRRSGAFLCRKNIQVQPTAIMRRMTTASSGKRASYANPASRRAKRPRSLIRNIALNQANAQKH